MDSLVGHKERNRTRILDLPPYISLNEMTLGETLHTIYALETEKYNFISALSIMKTQRRSGSQCHCTGGFRNLQYLWGMAQICWFPQHRLVSS